MADVSSTTGAHSRLHDSMPYQSTDRPSKSANRIPPSSTPKHPAAVARRNARERNRVRQVNMGFVTLRNHIPYTGSKSKKLSKVETLRQAANYIQYLRDMLAMEGEESRSGCGDLGAVSNAQNDAQNFFYATTTSPSAEQYFVDPYSSSHYSSESPVLPQKSTNGYCPSTGVFKISPSSSTDSPQSSSFGSSGASEPNGNAYECVTPPQLRHYTVPQSTAFPQHHTVANYRLPQCQSPIQPHSMKLYS